MTTDYKFTFQLFPDAALEGQLLELVDAFRARGLVNAEYVADDYRPHVTLACFRQLDRAHALGVAAALARHSAPLRLQFSHLGQFHGDPCALFLAPIYTDSLRYVHRTLHAAYEERSEECWHFYTPREWVPHCGLLIDRSLAAILAGASQAAALVPASGHLTHLGVTGFGPATTFELGAHAA